MNTARIALSAIAAGSLLAGSLVFAGKRTDKDPGKPALEEKKLKPQTHCPVMGGKINEDLHVDVDGKRIYVCCPGCINAVKKNPEKVLAKMHEQGVRAQCVKKAKACKRAKEGVGHCGGCPPGNCRKRDGQTGNPHGGGRGCGRRK